MDKTLFSAIAGLGGMFGWGSADFLASKVNSKIGNKATFYYSQIISLLAIIIFCFFLGIKIELGLLALILCIISGFFYLIGYLFFYRAFEIGRVSLVSSLISISAIFTAIIAFFVYGERIGTMQLLGISVVFLSAVVISLDFSEFRKNSGAKLSKGVKETIFSAVMFGVFYWPINNYLTSTNNWLFVNLIIKSFALLFLIIYFKVIKEKISRSQIQPVTWRYLVFIGLLDVFGLLAVSYGLSKGNPMIVMPISSAVSAVTVLLAVIFLKEKLPVYKWLCIGLIILGVALTAI